MFNQGRERGEVRYRWHEAVVHSFVCKQNSIFGENSNCSQDKEDKQVHVDVIPCTVEFSGTERENKKSSLREISHRLIKSQAGTHETGDTLQSNKWSVTIWEAARQEGAEQLLPVQAKKSSRIIVLGLPHIQRRCQKQRVTVGLLGWIMKISFNYFK